MAVSINLRDFPGEDFLTRIRAAMDVLKSEPDSTLTIPAGDYLLTSPLARQAQDNVMHGRWGENPQPVMFNPKYVYERGFDFAGHDGSTVIADGARITVDGFMEPVSIRDCKNVTFRGAVFDHLRRPYSRGVITDISKTDGGRTKVTVTLGEQYPPAPGMPLYLRAIVYSHSKARFDGNIPHDGPIVPDCEKKTLTFESGEDYPDSHLGDYYYTVHTYHSRPIILIENALNTRVEEVTIFSAPGMGITGQHSTDISVRRLRVIPAPGEHFSTNTDATHFASCRGKLRIENCEFDGQGDDSTNVHTYYHQIVRDSVSEDRRSCRTTVHTPDGTHAQTLDFFETGDTLRLLPASTLAGGETYRVTGCVSDFGGMFNTVTLDRPLPEDLDGLVFQDDDALPELEFTDCTARNHFARSVLIKCHKALVENCVFENVMQSAVRVAAEAGWGEGIASRSVTVRRCRVYNCGDAVDIRMDAADPSAPAHGSVLIEDNIVDCPHADHGILVSSTEKAVIRGNTVITRKKPFVIGPGVKRWLSE